MKPAFRFWSEVSLVEGNREPVTGSGNLGAAGIAVEQEKS